MKWDENIVLTNWSRFKFLSLILYLELYKSDFSGRTLCSKNGLNEETEFKKSYRRNVN